MVPRNKQKHNRKRSCFGLFRFEPQFLVFLFRGHPDAEDIALDGPQQSIENNLYITEIKYCLPLKFVIVNRDLLLIFRRLHIDPRHPCLRRHGMQHFKYKKNLLQGHDE